MSRPSMELNGLQNTQIFSPLATILDGNGETVATNACPFRSVKGDASRKLLRLVHMAEGTIIGRERIRLCHRSCRTLVDHQSMFHKEMI